ncbi:energy transducer TonB [Hyphococcus sp.]|uniref:energy transducer TonB n=1 Tax=Hyphococcus sp. TaxID=2038636 RepID=UPI0020815640|nr:MAG: hypothetical protein DHS20C04_15780 [Marinicaulis sp.]
MTLFRWIVGAPVAALITAGLFLMMAFLIREKMVDLPQPTERLDIKITAQKTDSPDEGPKPPIERLKQKPPETEFEFPPVDRTGGPTIDPEPFQIERNPPTDPGVVVGPTIRVAPPYPENCRTRGIEGLVVVQFDVTPEGNVVNPRIVDSPNACFNRPILKAVSNWKYSPASSGGMRYGVVERFSFQLEE